VAQARLATPYAAGRATYSAQQPRTSPPGLLRLWNKRKVSLWTAGPPPDGSPLSQGPRRRL